MAATCPEDVEALTLPSGVGVRLYRPTGATGTGPALLWIHGGGYVIGHPGQDDVLCRRYAQRLGVTLRRSTTGWRRTPLSRSGRGLLSALTWLAALPSVDPGRVAIGGASAGGGLAAALAFFARDRGEVAPLRSCWCTRCSTIAPYRRMDNPGLRLWNHSNNKFGWSAYLGDADPEVAVPARRTDLGGLPPAWMGVGTFDLFHDEDLAYAERLKAAGVPCDVEVVKGAFHGFDGIVPKAEVSQAFFNSQCAMLRRVLAPSAA